MLGAIPLVLDDTFALRARQIQEEKLEEARLCEEKLKAQQDSARI